jgi:hypothetical protein
VVSCSTRTYEDRYKNSYHITCPDVVFCNNHDGSMKRFASSLGLSAEMGKKIDLAVNVCVRVCGVCMFFWCERVSVCRRGEGVCVRVWVWGGECV